MIFYLLLFLLVLLISIGLAFYVLRDFYIKYTPFKKYKIYLDFIKKDQPGPYQVSLAEKYDLNAPKSENGAIVYKHYLTGDKAIVHPIRNTHVALAYYEHYINENDEADLQRFLDLFEAFLEHKVVLSNGITLWYYPPYKYYENQKVPWTSAMSQGQMLAVLARAFFHTKDQKHLEIGKSVLKSFQVTIEEGGVVYEDDFGVFYEEFAYWEEDKRNHTLNGMLSALFGIYDFYKVTGLLEAKSVFDIGVKTIKTNLHLYDHGYCSSYDLRHLVDPVNNFVLLQGRYNAVHVGHLKILHTMTDDDYFLAYAEQWDRKLKDPINRLRLTRWYVKYKLFEVRTDINRFGLFKVLIGNFKRFLKKKPMI